MNPILAMKNVSYSYHTPKGETKALSDISFSVEEGVFTSIVGPSGCGKSTLLSLISGLIVPDSGDILINDIPADKSNMHIGYMLQKDNLFEWRSVYRNVLLGLEMQKKKNPENIKKVQKMLQSVLPRPRAGHNPFENIVVLKSNNDAVHRKVRKYDHGNQRRQRHQLQRKL